MVPTAKEVTARAVRTEEVLVNMGPQHPATHGVLRIVVRTDGEMVIALAPHIGNLHRCAEKIGECVSYVQFVPYVDRMDYLAAINNELGICMTIEKVAELEVPPRAEWIRIAVTELNRVASHLMGAGTYGLDLGAFTPFLYCFREREIALDLLEQISGGRMLYHYIRIGGVARDVDQKWIDDVRAWCDLVEEKWHQYNTLLTYNHVFIKRTTDIGVIDRETALAHGVTGPALRAAGVDWDLRRDEPYGYYDQLEFEVPVGDGELGTLGDCWHRHQIRMKEIPQSISLVRQALERIEKEPGVVIPKNAFAPAPVHGKVPRVLKPKGEAYCRFENPRGELAYYVIGEGGKEAHRIRARGPSFCNLSVLEKIAPGHLFADLVAIVGSLDIVLGDVDR